MHAIRQHDFGGPDTLVLEEVPDLDPGDGQVRIAVEAAGVHLVDTTIRSGESGGPFPLPDLPMTPGREVAGRVDRTGPGVDPAWSGRRVVAHLGLASGGYAEQALAAVTALHALPDHVTAPAAVAMIGTGRTAMGILEVAGIAADDVVLVTAAAGGLGSLLVQAARPCRRGRRRPGRRPRQGGPRPRPRGRRRRRLPRARVAPTAVLAALGEPRRPTRHRPIGRRGRRGRTGRARPRGARRPGGHVRVVVRQAARADHR